MFSIFDIETHNCLQFYILDILSCNFMKLALQTPFNGYNWDRIWSMLTAFPQISLSSVPLHHDYRTMHFSSGVYNKNLHGFYDTDLHEVTWHFATARQLGGGSWKLNCQSDARHQRTHPKCFCSTQIKQIQRSDLPKGLESHWFVLDIVLDSRYDSSWSWRARQCPRDCTLR